MARTVKRGARAADPGRRAGGRTTKVSSKNQVTIPVAELRAAGLGPGDVLRVEALGAGRVALTRVDELVARYAGALDSRGRLRRRIGELRDEWP
jgi:bifunctional DNA-binding transcriptional regulator/antitoxin component of YhaV-PrlF toxin-antitoxin module